ncbi:MAG: heat-inducible transcriptional repressor HrcA [Candidatus Omnitrophica bacterium]|nr:heat-inducible transcriptional repressor HrcA [Candidatus Omnitrophota bacterium]
MRNESTGRRDQILDVIVRSYIETAEPVGSRVISRRHGLGLSPASIRNVMADLEEEGLLAQPHTSAGRVPTDRGYRYWVDSLMEPEELSAKDRDWVVKELAQARTIEALAEKVSKVISELTETAALLYIKNLKRVSFLHHLLEELVEAERLGDFFEEEPELFIEGAFRIFDQPEFQDARKIRLLLRAFDEKGDLLEILVKDLELEGIHVHIGRENRQEPLENVSLVVKDCYWGDTAVGGVAAVGPTRMRYPKVMSVVSFVADSLTEAMRRF